MGKKLLAERTKSIPFVLGLSKIIEHHKLSEEGFVKTDGGHAQPFFVGKHVRAGGLIGGNRRAFVCSEWVRCTIIGQP